jgi:hypothetical protein
VTYGDFLKDAEKYQEAAFLKHLYFSSMAPLCPLMELWENYKNNAKLIQQKLF